MRTVYQRAYRYGASFYGIIAFLVAFFGARLFAVPNPNAVVVQDGVHFHHFWHGLAMLALAGWLGISFNRERLWADLRADIRFRSGVDQKTTRDAPVGMVGTNMDSRRTSATSFPSLSMTGSPAWFPLRQMNWSVSAFHGGHCARGRVQCGRQAVRG